MESDHPLICVSICEQSIDAIEQGITQALPVADVVEIRLDCLDPALMRDPGVERLLERSAKPTIVTYRPAQQGGHQTLDNKTRLRFWLFDRPSTHFVDIEFDLVRNTELFEDSDLTKALDWDRVICSHHDFNGVSADLDRLYSEMARTPARILKIAVHAEDVVDCLPVFRLLDRARAEGRELISIAMGTAGIATRILGPSRGSFLTYAAREKERATAPGQITARELRETYRIEQLDRKTEIFGLVGSPVSHSVSPHIHNKAFAATQTNAVFIPFEVRDIVAFFKRMVHGSSREIDWNIRGLSVTAPHKSAVMDQLDWVEPGAKAIGAVNTVVINEKGLSGYNTDALGFLKALVEKGMELKNTRCAVIGAGGAASAAVWALSKEGARVTIFARNPERAALLARKFGVESDGLEAAGFDGFDLVVNATPLGTAGKSETKTAATSGQLRGAHLAYDLVYNPMQTRFLDQAREAGCETLGGLPMLVAQAVEQFKLWTGKDAPVASMREAAIQALGSG